MSTPRIDVDLDAIRHNVRTIGAAVERPLLAVVKANAYGHGAVPVARAALEAGATMLGVVDVGEGLVLREAGIEAPILAWLHGPATTWQEAFDAEIELGVSSIGQLERIAEDATAWRARTPEERRAPAVVHLKLDTGLGRNGAGEADWATLFARAAELERTGLVRVRGLFSHLSGASPDDDREQLGAFDRARDGAAAAGLAPSVRHLSATAGALAMADGRLDLVRLGVAMYGLSPFGPTEPLDVDLRPALRLVAPVVRVPDADGELRWAVEVGAVDGLPPIDGAALELADADGGRWTVRDVGATHTFVTPLAPPPSVEARAQRPAHGGAPADDATTVRELVVIGDPARGEPGADAWAAAAGTINYEVVTRLSAALPRRTTGGRDAAIARHADVVGSGGRTRPGDGTRRGSAPVTRPDRALVVDTDVFAARLGRADGSVLDVSADAYGLGLGLVLPLARRAGASLVVRTERDADHVESVDGVRPRVEPAAGDATRVAYGFGPARADAAAAEASRVAPVVALESELVLVKELPAGHGVSYGYTWVASRPTTVGLVPCGYGDGVVRRVGGIGSVLVAGVRRPIIGRVAMDQFVVDLGDDGGRVGDRVVLFGAGDAPSIAEWAGWSGIAPEAVVASLGRRVDRVPVADRLASETSR